jgi:hypothetical protein
MRSSSTFIDRLGADLERAYSAHSIRRRRRRVVVGVVALALAATATAGAVTGLFDGFTISQDQQANIVGDPPHYLACGPAGCIRTDQSSVSGGRWLYQLSHRVGAGLPTSGNVQESLTKQSAFGPTGKELSSPAGAEIAYACTTIDGDTVDCTPLEHVGTLPRGTAIYLLSLTEYPGYEGPSN